MAHKYYTQIQNNIAHKYYTQIQNNIAHKYSNINVIKLMTNINAYSHMKNFHMRRWRCTHIVCVCVCVCVCECVRVWACIRDWYILLVIVKNIYQSKGSRTASYMYFHIRKVFSLHFRFLRKIFQIIHIYFIRVIRGQIYLIIRQIKRIDKTRYKYKY